MITIDIDEAVNTLTKNDIIAMPTETVYGLAGNAFSDDAIKKIFALKNRPFYNPLIVHIKGVSYLNKIATTIPDVALKLADKFWPGPLTLILNKQAHISDLVTAGKETVGVRVPNHPIALALLNKLEFPLAAPSANPFGAISPTTASHVSSYFGEKLAVILDGGECVDGVESTIIGFENQQPVLYRHGSISIEEIENVIGEVKVMVNNNNEPNAPGMLSRHYAPKTEIYLTNNVAELLKSFGGKKVGLLLFKDYLASNKFIFQEVLSHTADFKEAAKNLYAALHRLDNLNLDIIIAEKLPNIGLGKTVNDRLQRAVSK